MNGFLNYTALRTKSRRGAAYGMASTGLAITMFLFPILLLLGSAFGEFMLAKPGLRAPYLLPTNLVLLIIPTLTMLILPILGLVFAAAGIAISRRECQFAIAGLIINIAVLSASLWTILMH